MKSEVWMGMMSGQFFGIKSFMATMNKNLSDHNNFFVLSDQDNVLVGDMSFQVQKIICSPGLFI